MDGWDTAGGPVGGGHDVIPFRLVFAGQRGCCRTCRTCRRGVRKTLLYSGQPNCIVYLYMQIGESLGSPYRQPKVDVIFRGCRTRTTKCTTPRSLLAGS